MNSSKFKGPAASDWVQKFLPLVPNGGGILDLACGGGRHIALARGLGYAVTAVDRDVSGLDFFADDKQVRIIEADLESGAGWPLAGELFAGIIVTNYLHRPLFPAILGALALGGVLVYETFARGNEAFGHPRNPDFLLRPGELLDLCRLHLTVVAYEHGLVERSQKAPVQKAPVQKAPVQKAMIQRICARR